MQNRCVSEEVLSICLANLSFINEIRVISFPHKNCHKIYIRYNMESLLYILYSPILRVMWSIQGIYVWTQNFTELLMNILCSKFPQKLYNYNPSTLSSIQLCSHLHIFSLWKKLILIPYTSTWLEPIKVLRWSSSLSLI